jgi:hypothetical protein
MCGPRVCVRPLSTQPCSVNLNLHFHRGGLCDVCCQTNALSRQQCHDRAILARRRASSQGGVQGSMCVLDGWTGDMHSPSDMMCVPTSSETSKQAGVCGNDKINICVMNSIKSIANHTSVQTPQLHNATRRTSPLCTQRVT